MGKDTDLDDYLLDWNLLTLPGDLNVYSLYSLPKTLPALPLTLSHTPNDTPNKDPGCIPPTASPLRS